MVELVDIDTRQRGRFDRTQISGRKLHAVSLEALGEGIAEVEGVTELNL